MNSNSCVSIKELAIDGDMLIQLGFHQDKELGAALNKLLKIVLEEPELNNAAALYEIAKNLKYNTIP